MWPQNYTLRGIYSKWKKTTFTTNFLKWFFKLVIGFVITFSYIYVIILCSYSNSTPTSPTPLILASLLACLLPLQVVFLSVFVSDEFYNPQEPDHPRTVQSCVHFSPDSTIHTLMTPALSSGGLPTEPCMPLIDFEGSAARTCRLFGGFIYVLRIHPSPELGPFVIPHSHINRVAPR